ncbi:MAG: geranylgeranylglycerol-phosphate geranylgeranyltransferase [Chitinophagaceae bacterium]
MKVLLAFFRMIRPLNLFFILLTQSLFQYCLLMPALKNSGLTPLLTNSYGVGLLVSSVCIAAAGYIINDYFDQNIDRINKPGKLILERYISRRWAMFWHFALSVCGLAGSAYVGWKVHHHLGLLAANGCCVVLLWFYSTQFKRQALVGNLIIALLTAWVIGILWWIEVQRVMSRPLSLLELQAHSRIFKFTVLYGGFAFIISLVRECAKDIEDITGDARYGCRTLPIVWGIQATKIFMITWMCVLIAALLIITVYTLPLGWYYFIGYSVLLILTPLIYTTRSIWIREQPAAFHAISNQIKFVMLTGILSMLFLLYYA